MCVCNNLYNGHCIIILTKEEAKSLTSKNMQMQRDETGIRTQNPPSYIGLSNVTKKTSKHSFAPQSSVPVRRLYHSLSPHSGPYLVTLLVVPRGGWRVQGGLTEDIIRSQHILIDLKVRFLASFSTSPPLNKIASGLQMSSCVLGAGAVASCRQLSFLWGIS